MKKENLEEFMKKISFDHINNLAEYKDLDQGTCYTMQLGHLIPTLEYIKATKDELTKLVFDMKIEKNIEFNTITETRPYPLYNDTQKEEDKNVIVDKEFEVYEIWNVTNALNVFKTFNNKDDAIKFYQELRKMIIDNMEK